VAKSRTIFRCEACGDASPKWTGRCPGCDQWNTIVEQRRPEREPLSARLAQVLDAPLALSQIEVVDLDPISTGFDEVDRVLGGGLVPGSVTLVGGEPGVGKSTLLLQVASLMACGGRRVLLASGEESVSQVRLRAGRLGALADSVFVASETSIPDVEAQVDAVLPEVLVIDSIQTMSDPDLSSAPGSVAQVRDCAHRLVRLAKERSIIVILVGHVTKDGSLAGPRVLEHVVDTVLSFEGDRHHSLRLLRAIKHRFGATNELGVFEMSERGLSSVADASGTFLADRRPGIAGSVVVPTMEGRRPMLVEIQTLVSRSALTTPRRAAQGLNAGRLGMLLAVLEQRAGMTAASADVHASAVGGVKVTEPGADLAVVVALASSLTGQPLAADLVACGEVGLGGEVRRVGRLEERMAEAGRLGFRRAVVPASAPDAPTDVEAIRIGTVQEALQALGLATVRPRSRS